MDTYITPDNLQQFAEAVLDLLNKGLIEPDETCIQDEKGNVIYKHTKNNF